MRKLVKRKKEKCAITHVNGVELVPGFDIDKGDSMFRGRNKRLMKIGALIVTFGVAVEGVFGRKISYPFYLFAMLFSGFKTKTLITAVKKLLP